MLFSEPAFLFFFLPLALLGGLLLPGIRLRNLWLVAASLFFYASGEKVGIMLGSILLNYGLGLWVGATRRSPRRRWAITVAVAANIAVLAGYKYTGFLLDNLNLLGRLLGHAPLRLHPIALPIGISFLTFHGMSYVIDVYRGDAPANKSFLEAALYLSLFPQLIAGPIIRYRDIADQIRERSVTVEDFGAGVQRFVMGLGKKLLLANTVASAADQIFHLPLNQTTAGMAWLAVGCYTLQIYFDFSGYSDMAIGLARMFGFRFMENFNYPYISTTITEFWRRWHISLSNWFRDYVFFPLGANRKGPARAYFNLVLVFFLCGLWHGASWTFALWGLFHGGLLVLERLGLARRVGGWWRPFRHAYALAAIMAGWVLFRSATLGEAMGLFQALAGRSGATGLEYTAGQFLDAPLKLALAAGLALATPVYPALRQRLQALPGRFPGWAPALDLGLACASFAGLALVFAASAAVLAAGTYNPFIYFKF